MDAPLSRRRELIRLYIVLFAESLHPLHPARDFFADRLERAVATLDAVADLGRWHARPG
ncbi:hypothetical protein [Phytohabitans rumicis]|uniref:Uncharacterized protein n=1 Tax=Phytohabitans rumicis TaxID=1076125 RepID=A0A6V8LLC6_9ACTN|nr:hypothetical protein [Phytohabitans rumicis]GFJ93445.1 hypothetical protein Prum_070870 [Phytohabitans rumicis]